MNDSTGRHVYNLPISITGENLLQHADTDDQDRPDLKLPPNHYLQGLGQRLPPVISDFHVPETTDRCKFHQYDTTTPHTQLLAGLHKGLKKLHSSCSDTLRDHHASLGVVYDVIHEGVTAKLRNLKAGALTKLHLLPPEDYLGDSIPASRPDLKEYLLILYKLLHENVHGRYADDGSPESRSRQTKAVRLAPVVRSIVA